MTQPLANTNLLDDNLKQNFNGNQNPRTERLKRTSQVAENPTVEQIKEDVEEKGEERSNPTNVTLPPTEYYQNKLPKKDLVGEKDTILGMNKMLFFGLVGIGLVVGGYFAYKKFYKKGTVAVPTPPIPAK